MNIFYTINGLNELIEKANKRGDFSRAEKITRVVDVLDMYEQIHYETQLSYAKGYVKILFYDNTKSIVPYSKIKEVVQDYTKKVDEAIYDYEQEMNVFSY